MKKIGKSIALILCLLVFAMFALGSGSESSTTELKDDSSSGSKTESTESEDSKEEKVEVTIEKQEIVNEKDIVITATEYEVDKIWGDSVKLLIENNSDKDVTVGCNALIVNDYMITDLFAADVAAGKKANESVSLSTSQLKAAGINPVGKIEIYFHVYESDSWDKVFDTDAVEIRTSGYDSMNETPNDAGKELYNDKGIRIVGKAVEEDDFWGSAILLYIENNSGKNVTVSVEDMSINGFMIDPFFAKTVYDGKKALSDITIFESDLEKNGIEKIEDVELQFHIYDDDTYDTIADSGAISFSVEE